ncbi:MAG: HAD family phosphatase [Bdellovibrionales bacterium]|nr:HAD family phosphatase [Bdellovibrionales bacterium]
MEPPSIKILDHNGNSLSEEQLRKYVDYDAYLYDCDGTIAETMIPHKTAWVEEIKNRGFALSPSLIDELAGMPAVQTVEVMNQRFGWGLNPQEVAQSKESLFLQKYIDQVQPIVEMVDHLKWAASIGKKIAVVSGGRTRVVKRTLEILGISNLIQVVICAEDVKIGKPHPEPFLMAAERFGMKPDRCLVFEDADFGVQAAKAAGMDWIRIKANDSGVP